MIPRRKIRSKSQKTARINEGPRRRGALDCFLPAVLLVFSLSACAELQQSLGQPTAGGGATPAGTGSSGPVEIDVTSPRLKTPGPLAEQTASLNRVARAIDPATLPGMTRAALEDLFGEPVFGRRDKGSELLRFKGSGCLLDAFLYLEKSGDWLVEHIETRDDEGRPVAQKPCLTDVASAGAETG